MEKDDKRINRNWKKLEDIRFDRNAEESERLYYLKGVK